MHMLRRQDAIKALPLRERQGENNRVKTHIDAESLIASAVNLIPDSACAVAC